MAALRKRDRKPRPTINRRVADAASPVWFRREWAIPLWGLMLIGLVILVFAVLIWSLKDRRESRVHPKPLESFTGLLPSIAGLTQGPILDGNAVTVIQDAAFFDALLADIEAAEESVHFETYVWWTGEICGRLGAALVERARAGLEVRVLLDAVGSADLTSELREEMKEAGVDLAFYRPFILRMLSTYNNRDHRKLAIVDGRIGYAFGHGVAEEWTAASDPVWEDTAIRVEGPLVGELQSVFTENWVDVTGDVPAGKAVFPELEPVGTVRGHVAASSHIGAISTVELLYKLAFASAQETVIVQNPYFLPDRDFLALILETAARGVRIVVMVPGAEGTDSKAVYHATHHHYAQILAAGIELWEYQPTLLHKKILIVDDLWSHVGSTNFDSRSFELNAEVSVGLIDEGIAAQLTRAFEHDRTRSRRVTVESWREEQTAWHWVVDRAAHLLHEQL